jgi:hypothetical protein
MKPLESLLEQVAGINLKYQKIEEVATTSFNCPVPGRRGEDFQ